MYRSAAGQYRPRSVMRSTCETESGGTNDVGQGSKKHDALPADVTSFPYRLAAAQSFTISTRRLFARPSGVAFFATGFVSP